MMNVPVKQATLLFLLDDTRILLAMKKRGFGMGHWNGVGGKPEVNETMEQAAIRECQEEIEVTPAAIKHVANLNFYFPDEKLDWSMVVSAYICRDWTGTPTETEEMKPKWFKLKEIPYDKMWADDRYWLPEVLAGYFVEGDFYFDENEKLTKHNVKTGHK